MRKIPLRLRGTNFCTSSARFASSFVKQPNGPGCTQIVRYASKCQFRDQWGGSGVFVWKNSNATSWPNFGTSSVCFAPSFVRQPNGPECTQMVRNALERQFRVQWSGSGVFVVKNSDATSWHELLYSSACFATSFVRQTNGPRCAQMVRNVPKRQFRDKWGGSGAFVAKNSDATSWHILWH